MFSLDGGTTWISKRADKDTNKLKQLWMAYTDEEGKVTIYRRFDLNPKQEPESLPE